MVFYPSKTNNMKVTIDLEELEMKLNTLNHSEHGRLGYLSVPKPTSIGSAIGYPVSGSKPINGGNERRTDDVFIGQGIEKPTMITISDVLKIIKDLQVEE